MWREFIESFGLACFFGTPMPQEELDELETALGFHLPSELRGLLLEANGISVKPLFTKAGGGVAELASEEDWTLGLSWSVEEMINENQLFRSWEADPKDEVAAHDVTSLTDLIFFGAEPNGDPVALQKDAGAGRLGEIVAMSHENWKHRRVISPSLREYLTAFLQACQQEKLCPHSPYHFIRRNSTWNWNGTPISRASTCPGKSSRWLAAAPNTAPSATTLGGEMRSLLRGTPCAVFNSDLRVTVMQTGLIAYPDVTVVCGEQHRHPLDKHSIINPSVLFEVLSPTTEAYDRGEKWAHYRRLDSLQEYILVSQNKARVEQYVRQDDGSWKFTAWEGLEASLFLPSLGCSLSLAEVYDRIVFEEVMPQEGATPPTASDMLQ